MTGALIILIAVAVVGVVLYAAHRINVKRNGGVEEPIVEPTPQDECCGQHEVCEKDMLLAFIDKEIVYYNDEELDAYIGKFPED